MLYCCCTLIKIVWEFPERYKTRWGTYPWQQGALCRVVSHRKYHRLPDTTKRVDFSRQVPSHNCSQCTRASHYHEDRCSQHSKDAKYNVARVFMFTLDFSVSRGANSLWNVVSMIVKNHLSTWGMLASWFQPRSNIWQEPSIWQEP